MGGSGALKVGADFLKRYFPESEVWVPDPTWDNHVAIFEGAGFRVHTYPYFDPQTLGVAFDAMLVTLQALPARSVVLLHPCCHNPTGSDLTPEQWDRRITSYNVCYTKLLRRKGTPARVISITQAYPPIIANAPCARLMKFIRPIVTDSPMLMMNSRLP